MPDHYTYSDSEILKNKLNISDEAQLKRKEDALYSINLKRAYNTAVNAQEINLSTLNTIHEQLFRDLYGWAGKPRRCELSKGGTPFCRHDFIEKEAGRILAELARKNYYNDLPKADYIKKLADLYGDLNLLHPYREGNGRALKILFHAITLKAGYEIDWTNVTKDEHLQAVIDTAHGKNERLEAVFERVLNEEVGLKQETLKTLK